MRFFSIFRHYALFGLVALHVAGKYIFKLKPRRYAIFIGRAWRLLLIFRHNRVVRVKGGWKLDLYLPAWPSRAFFDTLEGKLLRCPPAPATMVFSMTRACAYHCPHCYQKLEQGTDLPLPDLSAALEASFEAGIRYFNIEGGEPFLRPERLWPLLEALRGRAETWVNTTGDRADQAALSRAAGLGLKGIMVSLHSPVPEIHDSFTGRAGSFTVAHEAIRLAKSLGLGVCINSVLSEPELRGGALAALMDLARSLEVDFVQLIHLKPCGPWLDKEDGLALEPDLLSRMESAHLHYNSWRTAGYPALSAQVFEERGASLGCTAGGIDRFYLTSSGEVLPCEFLQISFGNVLDEEFTVIFERMRHYFSVPGLDWPCCTKNKLISGLMKKHNLTATPLPWNHTRELMANWSPGPVTPLYDRLGIYRPEGRK